MINAQKKYRSTAGLYQEKEGPEPAKNLLIDENLSKDEIDRICYIIGHHHTFSKVQGTDFQILWEADILEALKKLIHKNSLDNIREAIYKNFKTKSGIKLAEKVLLTKLH